MMTSRQPSDEEQERRFRALLADDDDEKLFTHGGCCVFASALHEAFGYKLVWLPGHSDFAMQGIFPVSHVFGLLIAGDEFAVDVKGTRKVGEVLRAFGADQAVLTTTAELSAWRDDSRRGIYNRAWFLEGAMDRARKRIETYGEYFDGSKKETIPRQSGPCVVL